LRLAFLISKAVALLGDLIGLLICASFPEYQAPVVPKGFAYLPENRGL
jgi:hypothetical protein